MKKARTKPVTLMLTPVFPQVLHQLRPTAAEAAGKDKKRDNIFSKSRDTREARNVRQSKTSHNAQTFSKVR
jgi:hypothetical protein